MVCPPPLKNERKRRGAERGRAAPDHQQTAPSFEAIFASKSKLTILTPGEKRSRSRSPKQNRTRSKSRTFNLAKNDIRLN